jgi:hypothetical protein
MLYSGDCKRQMTCGLGKPRLRAFVGATPSEWRLGPSLQTDRSEFCSSDGIAQKSSSAELTIVTTCSMAASRSTDGLASVARGDEIS